MRIIAGVARGRRLRTPRAGTRPLTGRAREALFSSLGHELSGARVLDLYAGSGALGLEALSRGAGDAVFVESSRAALRTLRANIAAVGLGGSVVAGAVDGFLATDGGRYDLVFVDPPYALPLASVERVLTALVPRLDHPGRVVVHRRAGGGEPHPPPGLAARGSRRYGDVELWRFDTEGDRE